MNVFITSHFSCCQFDWMFHSQKLNDHTDKLQESPDDCLQKL